MWFDQMRSHYPSGFQFMTIGPARDFRGTQAGQLPARSLTLATAVLPTVSHRPRLEEERKAPGALPAPVCPGPVPDAGLNVISAAIRTPDSLRPQRLPRTNPAPRRRRGTCEPL